MVPENYKKLAIVGQAWKGKYSSDKSYKYMNGVTYQGSSYVALKDNPDGEPKDDGINWQMTASKGDDGRIDANCEEVFDSHDGLKPEKWTDVDLLKSGETHKSILEKISIMFKNIRYLLNMYDSLNSNIIAGSFNNAKSGDAIKLPRAVSVTSVVLVQPSFNSSELRRCTFSSNNIAAGSDTFTLFAFDTKTQDSSTSTALAGRYIVVPITVT